VKEVAPRDFAALFGLRELPPVCAQLAAKRDFRYEVPVGAARDEIVMQVMRHIDSDKPTQVGEHRADIWESCWSDNLEKFRDGAYDPEKLVPDFIKPGQPIRLNQDYVLPKNPRFELDFFQICRAFLFERFFSRAESVYEFGCGSGFNLLALAQQLPGKTLCGLDWSRSSNEMLNIAGKKLSLALTGRHFDFFKPDATLVLGPRSAVLTMCALEQVGSRHGSFVDFLLEKKPAVCVNMEPLIELYDESRLADYLAIKFHRKRGYLEGFVTSLRELEAAGRIEILELRRFFFGSIYHEGYSYVAWRPR
jgi:SAM-dependent methyltransferase